MSGPTVHVQISYIDGLNISCNGDYTSSFSNDFVVFEPNCYRSLKYAASFGGFGLTIKELPKYVKKIKFEYQLFCAEANYVLLVPATNNGTGKVIMWHSDHSNHRL
eukprot:TRINITY_DN12772_c0_g1_i1.p1 TRINITY_DN12772_c0_g1~~TRINITY_DN12772_c0_g1_i1.p1  ORF type:complete len:106 (-),score=7.58 TRINITY_DN12772_c0_g1_i1:131-448(-)